MYVENVRLPALPSFFSLGRIFRGTRNVKANQRGKLDAQQSANGVAT